MAATNAKRIALVIGNSRYSYATPLTNTLNDASAIAASLTRIGFSGVTASSDGKFAGDFDSPVVTANFDLSNSALGYALAAFQRLAKDAAQAVLYYAGHGMELNGQNYLIPVDASLPHEDDVEYQTVGLTKILNGLDKGDGLRLVILDACRNNPFEARLFASRGASRGLVAIEAPNVMIIYAAAAGKIALDDVKQAGTKSANSPFATALLKHMETPGQRVDDLIGHVRDEVISVTNNAQRPWASGSYGVRKHFLVPALVEPAPRPGPSPDPDPRIREWTAQETWETLQASSDLSALRRFVAGYGDTRTGPIAKKKLETLVWRGIKVNNVTALASYLVEFPDGKNSKTAQQLLNKLRVSEDAKKQATEQEHKAQEAWTIVQKADDLGSMEQFLKWWPKSKYAGQARKRIAELKPVPPVAKWREAGTVLAAVIGGISGLAIVFIGIGFFLPLVITALGLTTYQVGLLTSTPVLLVGYFIVAKLLN